MPKTRRHGGLSLFHSWQATACLRAQNENPIPADIVFGAQQFSARGFLCGKGTKAQEYYRISSFLTQPAREAPAENHIVFDSR